MENMDSAFQWTILVEPNIIFANGE